MISFRMLAAALLATSLLFAGCAYPWQRQPDGRHRSTAVDATFKRRHADLQSRAAVDPIMGFARDLTIIEDDLRRDGTITVKKPDVWGDGNLMHFLQEFDAELAQRTKKFDETLQAYIARSDSAEFQSSTSFAASLGGGAAPAGGTAVAAPQNNTTIVPTLIDPHYADIDDVALFDLISKAKAAAPPSASGGIGVEPTELARQHATYIDVCQALRRRHMGDDNSRAAGYGLYKFRVPVSVLPGRETHRGHSAVVSLRAQLEVDEAHLRYTFPKLVIADLVDALTPILRDYKHKCPTAGAPATHQANAQPTGALAPASSAQQKQAHELKVKAAKADFEEEVGNIEKGVSKLPASDAKTALTTSIAELKALIEADKEAADESIVDAIDCVFKKLIAHHFALLSGGMSTPEAKTAAESLKAPIGAAKHSLSQMADRPDAAVESASGAPTAPPVGNFQRLVGDKCLQSLHCQLEESNKYRRDQPLDLQEQEIREFLFSYLSQVHSAMEAQNVYSLGQQIIHEAGICTAKGQIDQVKGHQDHWHLDVAETKMDVNFQAVSWCLALQSGVLNQNLLKIVEDLELKGKVSRTEVEMVRYNQVQFYAHDRENDLPDPNSPRVQLWRTIVREAFPLHVFTIDPQVEEQNVYDAFARRREMQLALAYSVAKGRINTAQKLAYSRQLGLDVATIDLNRTCVGFSHGNDTFGWYFYPRVQAPPTESTNIGSFVRTIWSTGPTEHYDLKHRQLEPGMRECEVLIAMPSFVTEVSFDVTTNWESIAHPGVTKRSYEEMIAQGGRVHQMKMCLGNLSDDGCYRPGDIQRMVSRVDQLEQMLGMQTHIVDVPYEYEQSGTALFSKGDVQLKPQITGTYGLSYLQADSPPAKEGGAPTTSEASFFLTGKNFHPTLTHVIVGGQESHFLGASENPTGELEVISRELLRVKVTKLNKSHSIDQGFEVRVGTPAGLSNPLFVSVTPSKPAAPAPKGFSFLNTKSLGALYFCCDPDGFQVIGKEPNPVIVSTENDRFFVNDGKVKLIAEITATAGDGTALTFKPDSAAALYTKEIDVAVATGTSYFGTISMGDLRGAVNSKMREVQPLSKDGKFTLKITGYLVFGNATVVKMLDSIEVSVTPCGCEKPAAQSPPAAGGANIVLPCLDAVLGAGEQGGGLEQLPPGLPAQILP
ncbi:hypothetical protein Psta_0382 [Pirellula staleyi DSM 6068]|uniref:Uncharacterized protein n=1 Tax=Pirellula staleyi (strain ATCC 27377 / DSM 6068 / ICPB 4128) TaxID=530564 RepID=D2R2G3_PIRSD|nr:hypothetical protein [Pirellula staleyi]ADB15072.1 hypothetical protein Psta_0382 [Pirellula staleyi DSM 6068]